MEIVITCALPFEFNSAKNELGLREETLKGDLPRVAKKDHVTLIYTGLGKVNTLINLYENLLNLKDLVVIDTGTCGSLNNKLHPLDIVTINRSLEFYNYETVGKKYSIKKEGLLTIFNNLEFDDYINASIEDSVSDPKKRNLLVDRGCSVVSWETSSVFEVCNKLKIPCFSKRVITDNCDENTFKDFKNNKSEACKKLYISVKKLCKGI
ncbi:hypothetical protein EW093_03280 [Thiospirochaeta perfilievii]|uniref:Nucleoside phosphorylase domain-containing protein n=1 Tax=Thiospirochaeta perfilievii TaxID=252967 RepID=A0A5C1Q8E7_9SPIO|nr:5'-methylthioadenosine/S-adenosylhomocysteine nucleosidase [Thiospirochaeta perfilievii]QEN03761.1 hypothetical protein EW093_03280 [Thiospirochaeta perfilievii]